MLSQVKPNDYQISENRTKFFVSKNIQKEGNKKFEKILQNSRKKNEEIKEEETGSESQTQAQDPETTYKKQREILDQFLEQAENQESIKTPMAEMNEAQIRQRADLILPLQKDKIPIVKSVELKNSANKSSGAGRIPPDKKELKISFYLDTESNTSGKKTNLTRDTLPKLVGHTTPGGIVAIKQDGKLIGYAVTDPSGYFAFNMTEALPDGKHQFEASIELGGDRKSAGLELEIKSRIDQPGFEVLRDDIPIESKDKNTFLIKNPTASINGTAEPDSNIFIRVDNKIVGFVKVNAEGQWQYRFGNGRR